MNSRDTRDQTFGVRFENKMIVFKFIGFSGDGDEFSQYREQFIEMTVPEIIAFFHAKDYKLEDLKITHE